MKILDFLSIHLKECNLFEHFGLDQSRYIPNGVDKLDISNLILSYKSLKISGIFSNITEDSNNICCSV